MGVPWLQVPAQDGQYQYDRPWQLLSERIATDRAWQNASPPWASPVVPTADPQQMIPPMYGYRSTELTIYDVLDNVYSRLQSSPIMVGKTDDFTGQQGGYESTLRPTGAGGGGIV